MSRTETYVHKGSYHVTNIANRFKVVVGQSVISRSVNLSKVSTALSLLAIILFYIEKVHEKRDHAH